MYSLARDLDIAGRGSLSRVELIRMLQLLLVEPPVSRSLAKANVPAIQPVIEKPETTETTEVTAKTRRGRPPKNAVMTDDAVKRPRGRPKKNPSDKNDRRADLHQSDVKADKQTESGEKPRRGRPPKNAVLTENSVKRPRGRPPKVTAVAENVGKRPRGRPPKNQPKPDHSADIHKLDLNAQNQSGLAEKPRRGRPPKKSFIPEKASPVQKSPVAVDDSLPAVEKRRRGRPPRNAMATTGVAKPGAAPQPEKIGRNAEKLSEGVAAPHGTQSISGSTNKSKPSVERFNRECEEEAAAMKRLNRAFAKRDEELPHSENKKGAEVREPAVAMPVHHSTGSKANSSRAEEIELERRRKHASLKTTMEIPVFSVPVYGAAAVVREEELTGDLPEHYDETRLVMQIRDPHWAHTYWELPPVERKRLELEVGIFEFAHSHFVLRLHDVTNGHTQEIRLTENARDWYLHLENAQCVYQVELGMQSPTEGYTFIALSNLVQTPPDSVALRWAEPVAPQPPEPGIEFGSPEANAVPASAANVAPPTAHLTDPVCVYRQAPLDRPLQFSGSSEQSGAVQPSDSSPAIPASQIFSAGVSSFALPSSSQEMPGSHFAPGAMPGSDMMPSSQTQSSDVLVRKSEESFLCMAADLIVYGRAPAGWQLFFLGQQVDVRPDGSFSLRLALPENVSQHLELTAVDPRTGQQQVIRADFAYKKE